MNDAVRAFGVDAPHPPSPPLPDPDRQRLVAAGVTAAVVQEPALVDPRLRHAGPDPDRDAAEAAGIAPVSQPEPTALTAITRIAHPAVPYAPTGGLRLIPLSGFHWGGAVRGRNMPPAPRVRGDHVLILLERGVLQVEFPRSQQLLGPGRVAFIPAGTAFALQPGADMQGRALLIAPTHGRGLPIALPTAFRFGAPTGDDLPLIDPAMQALGVAQPRTAAGDAAIACQLGLLAIALSRLDSRASRQDAARSRVAEARPLTERFLELAQAELAQSQTIAEMAGKLGHSQAQLDRACRQSRGRGALELLYDLRLQRAAEALRNSARPVAEIAQQLGYAGLGHFIRSFSAATGRSPEAYRDIMHGDSRSWLGRQFS